MPSSVIKSARRVFEVLEYFDDVRRPASLHDIVSHFGYPLSSGYSLLKSIVAMGYLDYDKASRTYMPTMRVATLGHWVQDALFGDNRILPFHAAPERRHRRDGVPRHAKRPAGPVYLRDLVEPAARSATAIRTARPLAGSPGYLLRAPER